MKVAFFPHQSHCYAFGGFEIQMLDAAEAIRNVGVDVVLQDCWSRDGSADIVHHWGMGYLHVHNIRWAKKRGQRVVMTVLLPYYETVFSRIKSKLSMCVGESRLSKENLTLADSVVVVNEIQADVLVRQYGVPAKKICVIPNIITSDFWVSGGQKAKGEDYWLCAGNVCARKNQIRAVQAAIISGIKIKIVGDCLLGEEIYGKKLRNLVENNSSRVEWLRSMPKNDPEYIKILQHSNGLILVSFEEQQPIIALEMLALGKPVILGDRLYSRQKVFENCMYANPNSVDSIVSALKNVDNCVISNNAILACRDSAVGDAYRNVYSVLV